MSRLFWILMAAIGVGAVLLMLNDSAGSTLGVENNDFSRLIWLGAFGALIGAGLLRSGRPLGAMARNLGAWAAIALALIASYQYRYEL
ncbi:TIGR02281 family clan AA aspartic protease, partial [Mesorhizobium sp. M7A.F.Ca.US.007.01.1.1]